MESIINYFKNNRKSFNLDDTTLLKLEIISNIKQYNKIKLEYDEYKIYIDYILNLKSIKSEDKLISNINNCINKLKPYTYYKETYTKIATSIIGNCCCTWNYKYSGQHIISNNLTFDDYKKFIYYLLDNEIYIYTIDEYLNINCTNCINSTMCVSISDENNCMFNNCMYCNIINPQIKNNKLYKCIGCNDCIKCNNCMFCNECIKCDNSNDCIKCYECVNCASCCNVYNSIKCNYCNYCYNCLECKYVNNVNNYKNNKDNTNLDSEENSNLDSNEDKEDLNLNENSNSNEKYNEDDGEYEHSNEDEKYDNEDDENLNEDIEHTDDEYANEYANEFVKI